MIYVRKNGKRSFFKNSYQEIASFVFIGAISCQLAIKGLERVFSNSGDYVGYSLIIQCVIYNVFFILKFKKYYKLVD